MPRTPPKNVVVVTGASSAAGQALALEFAVRGDAVVLAGPSEESLENARRACDVLGAWTHSVVVEDRSERSVRQLAQAAIERFGRIDIWINHVAPFERTTADDDGEALATEMAAFEHGASTALLVFDKLERGVLVNIDGYANVSNVSEAAKVAVRAQFTDIEKEAAKVASVAVHSVVTTPGVSWQDLAERVAGLARSEARGDAIGRAVSLLTRSQMRVMTTARKARRKLDRDVDAHTVVLSGGGRPSRKRGENSSESRRGGWHFAEAQGSEYASTLMVLVALPLVMAGVLVLLVRS